MFISYIAATNNLQADGPYHCPNKLYHLLEMRMVDEFGLVAFYVAPGSQMPSSCLFQKG